MEKLRKGRHLTAGSNNNYFFDFLLAFRRSLSYLEVADYREIISGTIGAYLRLTEKDLCNYLEKFVNLKTFNYSIL
jgi:hypothetical protein